MNPTTAADRMLVSSNITSSLDWMLTRDITGRRKGLRLLTGSVLTPESGSTDVASPLRPVLKGGMGVLSAVNAAARRLACETCMHRHSEGIEMSGSPDPYDLQRFIDAQEPIFDAVLGELRRGRKRSHWIGSYFHSCRDWAAARPHFVTAFPRCRRRGPIWRTPCWDSGCGTVRAWSRPSTGRLPTRSSAGPTISRCVRR